MNKHDPQNPPEPGRMIRCIGEDETWNFDVLGKFESPSDGERAVFCLELVDGTFMPHRYKWNHTRRWEYVGSREAIPEPSLAAEVEP